MVRGSVLIALVVLARAAGAQPAGPEFRVNTYTMTHQYLSTLAADALGNFVVVWNSYPGQDGDGAGVFGQRFDARGNRRGGEFAVNTTVLGHQYGASIAMQEDGTAFLSAFTVTWTDGSGLDGDYYGIFGQRYDASGSPAGSEFRVNAYTIGDQFSPAVAYTPTGDFVVVWTSTGGQDGSGYGVFGQRFSSAGVRLGSEFQVNSYTLDRQWGPAIAAGPTGQFVVVWHSYDQDGEYYGIFGQRFDAAANRLGAEFRVNTYTTSDQDSPDIAMDGTGGFVVVWDSYDQDGSGWGIFGQRFAAAGTPLGTEFRVNTYTTSAQRISSVARDPDGDFVVAWTSSDQVGSGDSVFAQRFGAGGAKLGAEFQVNTYVNAYTTSYQRRPAVASMGDDKFVVTWTSFSQDGDGEGIFAQLYADLIFANGFNAGP